MQLADWSVLQKRADLTVFRDNLSQEDSLVERLKPFQVLCLMRERTPLPRRVLERLPNLRLISFTGHKNASMDLAAAKELGITVCNTGGSTIPSHGADELTWGLILSLVRNLPKELDSVRKGGWQLAIGTELQGKTMGILGLGRIGKTTSRIALAFGMDVIAWSQNLTPEAAARSGVRLVSKDELFKTADVISVHLVLSERTRKLIGAHELGLMKPTAYLVNTSRGPIVDETALIDSLRKQSIAGAALDVYDVEPLPVSHPFRSLPNVIATPHLGFVTREGYATYYTRTIENVLAWMDKKPTRLVQHLE